MTTANEDKKRNTKSFTITQSLSHWVLFEKDYCAAKTIYRNTFYYVSDWAIHRMQPVPSRTNLPLRALYGWPFAKEFFSVFFAKQPFCQNNRVKRLLLTWTDADQLPPTQWTKSLSYEACVMITPPLRILFLTQCQPANRSWSRPKTKCPRWLSSI